MTRHDDVDTTSDAILAVFAEFDAGRTGRVPLSVLLHVLCEVDTPSALTLDEVNELLRMSGVLNEETLADPRRIYTLEVDYAAFLKHLMFPLPRKGPLTPAAPGAGAAAPASARAGSPPAARPGAARGPASPTASAGAGTWMAAAASSGNGGR
jgi:hypothetical protein